MKAILRIVLSDAVVHSLIIANNNTINNNKHMKNHGRTAFLSALSKSFLAAPLLVVAVSSCEDSDFDKYYERPGWLESPAWSVLEKRGDCETYLSLVEKTLYSKQLEGSGSYTFFVPTDSAFAAFFRENPYGYRSVDDIPADVASDMVSFLMLYNAYPCDSLGNILEGYNTWEIGGAYKHRTPSYDVLVRDYVNGDSIWIYDYPGSTSSVSVSLDWHNYRYLPVFAESYMRENGLLTSDYAHFFSEESTWSPYGNVLDAQIEEVADGSGDLYCENGVIHLIDKVVMPLKNLDRMIIDYGAMQKNQSEVELPDEAKGGAWSHLKDFLYHKSGNGSYMFLDYTTNTTFSHYFEKMYPDRDFSSFRVRRYTNMPFWLNYEEYSGSVEGEDTYNSGVTLFLPTEEVLTDYVNNHLLAYVDNKSDWSAAFNQLSEDVLPTFWKTLLSNGIIWPSQYGNAQNSVGAYEAINGHDSSKDFASTVLSSAFASNGLYHVINYFPRTAAFEGVGSRFLLDSRYGFMERIYVQNFRTRTYSNMLLSSLSGTGQIDLTLILTSDANLAAYDGIHTDLDGNDVVFKNGNNDNVNSAVNRMGLNGYIERDTTDRLDLEVDPLHGAYGGWAFTNTSNGEVLRYKKTGQMVGGRPEIAVQTVWSLSLDANGGPSEEDAFSAMPQVEAESPKCYTAVVKDIPASGEYVNGNVYVAEENALPLSYTDLSYNTYDYLEWYLRCDSAQEVPQHSIFKSYWDLAKKASTKPAFGSGNYTILVPTDEALQYAIDHKLMVSPSKIAAQNSELYYDSAAHYVNVYLLSTGCFPDDGASNLYSPSVWTAPNTLLDLSAGLVASTSYKPMTEDWEDFMSGTTKMSMRLQKIGSDNKMRFLGRDYESGIYTSVKAYNGSNENNELFDNTVVRTLGQSNVIAPNSVIHSFNGFVVYHLQPNPAKQPVTE